MNEEITREFFWIPRLRDLKKHKKRPLIKYNILKWALISIDLVFFTLFLLSLLIALFIGTNDYNPIYNAISDLGSSRFTPAAFIFDISLAICSVMMFISILVFKSLIPLESKNKKKSFIISAFKISGLTFGMIACIGLVMGAIFSVDRDPGIYHYFGAILFFGGAVISISFINTYKTCYKPDFKRFLGFLSPLVSIFALTFWFFIGLLIFEWIAFLSILIYILLFQIKFFEGAKINGR